MRFTVKLGERFSISPFFDVTMSSFLQTFFKIKINSPVSVSQSYAQRHYKNHWVTPVSLSLDILALVIPNVDSIGSELALCTSPSFKRESSRSKYPKIKSQLFAVAHASTSSFLSRVFATSNRDLRPPVVFDVFFNHRYTVHRFGQFINQRSILRNKSIYALYILLQCMIYIPSCLSSQSILTCS